jgi:HK97 family phage portal protein
MSFGDEGSLSGGNVMVSPSLETALRLDGTFVNPDRIYRTQPAVRICVDFLAYGIAHTALKTYRRVSDSERESASDSQLGQLLLRPNPRMSAFELILALVSDWALWDDAYWLKARSGSALALYRLPPAFVVPTGGDILTGPSSYTVNTGSASPQVFPADEVVHFHGYNPRDTRLGQSKLQALAMVLREETEASRWRAKFWEKSARKEGLLKRPSSAPEWDQAEKDRFREGWRLFQRHGSLEGETPILEDDMDYVEAAFSPKDSEFIAGREWALDTVATAYNIPLSALSRKQTPTFASAKEFRKSVYVDTYGPIDAMIESTIAMQLVPEFDDPDLYCEFNIAEKLQGDFESSADAFRGAVQVPWMSVNGARIKNNEAPIGDPNDPNNPFNIPATPANYGYTSPDSLPAPPALVVPAAGNGHKEIVSLLED